MQGSKHVLCSKVLRATEETWGMGDQVRRAGQERSGLQFSVDSQGRPQKKFLYLKEKLSDVGEKKKRVLGKLIITTLFSVIEFIN